MNFTRNEKTNSRHLIAGAQFVIVLAYVHALRNFVALLRERQQHVARLIVESYKELLISKCYISHVLYS